MRAIEFAEVKFRFLFSEVAMTRWQALKSGCTIQATMAPRRWLECTHGQRGTVTGLKMSKHWFHKRGCLIV